MSLLLATSGDIASSEVSAEGVDFDGTYDYLSRSTDLVGNVDSKTFTFSCWAWNNGTEIVVFQNNTTNSNYIYFSSNGSLSFVFKNSANTTILDAYTAVGTLPIKTFVNILISIDTTSTTKRHVYVNDKLISTTWSTYLNDTIDFTKTPINIMEGTGVTGTKSKGRLSNIFLDYTYRDLSIEANRRLFITADGKPTPTATLKALNPILYLPMKDAATAHINEGTGGNFTANGTFATSNRGANQDNCVASYFDGTADYLSRTSLTGIADGKQFTLSFNYKTNSTAQQYAFEIADSTTGRFNVLINNTELTINGYNSAGTRVLFIGTPATLGISKNIYVSVSVDMSDVNKCHIIINGSAVVVSKYTFTVDSIIDFLPNTPVINIGRKTNGGGYVNGNIGELYLDTKYIDLATSNPFWDSVENKPKTVRQVIRETGVTPLIAMPLDASNAGKNYGTGGDFTANSAPYVGARGASEFWARSAKSDGSTGRLSRGNIPTLLDSKTVSCLCAIYLNSATAYDYILSIGDSGTLPNFKIMTNGTTMWIDGSDSTYTRVMQNSFSCITGQWLILFASFDLANTSNRYLSLNGVVSSNWSTYINAPLGFTGHSEVNLFNDYVANTANIADACIGSIYFTTDYIDFSQEVNRLKFVDAFNMPLDLASQIDKGIIPKPLVYLPFSDASNLGLNLGTGGNFSVVGSVTQGSDVNG